MAQIPIFGGSQQIQASSPVAIGSGENARMQGEATAGFGETMFKLGNALDAVGRRAKENADRWNSTRAIELGEGVLIEEAAVAAAQGLQPDDRADGYSGVERFKERIADKIDRIGQGLGDPQARAMFYSGISSKINDYSVKVLTNEVVKRERSVPILRQQTVMAMADVVRKNPSLLLEKTQELEINVNNDTMVSDANKPAAILDGKKQLVGTTIEGWLDKGNQGDMRAWDQARSVLRDQAGLLYTKEEASKMMDDINSNQYGWVNRTIKMNEWNEKLELRDATKAMQDSMTKYTTVLSEAGNSDIKRGPIMRMIEWDPTFDRFPEKRKALIESRTFMAEADDRYEIAAVSEVLLTKDYKKLIDRIGRDQGESVSLERGARLLKMARDFQDSARRDPSLTALIQGYAQEILGDGPGTEDFSGGFYAQERKEERMRLKNLFLQRIARISDNLSESTITKAFDATVGNRIAVRKPVEGIAAERIQTTQGIADTAADIRRKYKTATPAQKIKLMEQLRGLQENKKGVEMRENMQIKQQIQSAPTRAYDDR